jgi:hypothetical protein
MIPSPNVSNCGRPARPNICITSSGLSSAHAALTGLYTWWYIKRMAHTRMELTRGSWQREGSERQVAWAPAPLRGCPTPAAPAIAALSCALCPPPHPHTGTPTHLGPLDDDCMRRQVNSPRQRGGRHQHLTRQEGRRAHRGKEVRLTHACRGRQADEGPHPPPSAPTWMCPSAKRSSTSVRSPRAMPAWCTPNPNGSRSRRSAFLALSASVCGRVGWKGRQGRVRVKGLGLKAWVEA